MHAAPRWTLRVVGLVGALFLAAGCPTGCTDPCATQDCGETPQPSNDAGVVMEPDAGPRHRYASLEIDPQDVMLQTSPGVEVTQAFTVTGITHDGTRELLSDAAWSVPQSRVGSIDEAGMFRADGHAAGTLTVQALSVDDNGLELAASTTVTVAVQGEQNVPGAPTDAIERFNAAAPSSDTSGAAQILYPLAGAMLPRNVAAPDLQWEGGAEGDLFRIRLQRGPARVDVHLVHSGAGFQDHWQIDTAIWRLMTSSETSEPLTITVDRLPPGSSVYFRSTPLDLRISRGSIYGLVYFWQLTPGRILRINAETAERESFMGTPPAYPPGSESCVACHSVSPNGRYLAGQVGGADARKGSLFDLTKDLSNSPAETLYPINQVPWGPSSFSPDSSRLVVSSMPGLKVIDPLAGMTVAATGLPTAAANHPAWAPDGSAIAYIATDETWSYQFDKGDLMIIPQTAPDTFGPPVRLHLGQDLQQSPEGGRADMRPSWSPDSRYIAFAHGRQESDPQDGAIYLIKPDGTGMVRLSRISDGPGGSQAFWPTFSPFTTVEDDGERYYWMGFYSRRPYGNAAAGTTGQGVRQLWVTAIRADAPDGEDPSQVPYWLPGQDTLSHNIAGQWAAAACRANKDACTTNADCCTGNCSASGGEEGICMAPPEGECREQGRTCSESTDCCGGLACIANICSTP